MRSENVIEYFEEIDSRRGVANISSRGSNWCGSREKRLREQGLMGHFFTYNAETVVQNKRSGKMT